MAGGAEDGDETLGSFEALYITPGINVCGRMRFVRQYKVVRHFTELTSTSLRRSLILPEWSVKVWLSAQVTLSV